MFLDFLSGGRVLFFFGVGRRTISYVLGRVCERKRRAMSNEVLIGSFDKALLLVLRYVKLAIHRLVSETLGGICWFFLLPNKEEKENRGVGLKL